MHKDAVEDGIRFVEKRGVGYLTKYYPKCRICGNEVMSFNYIRGQEYTCKECRLNSYLKDKNSREIIGFEAKEKKLDEAIRRMRIIIPYSIRDYNNAIEIVKKNLHRDGWFDSTEEIMAALELLKNRVKTRHQVKFGRYRADFVLPDEKVVLEIDGTLFHTEKTMEKENIRDNLIVLSLGSEWEVIRITDKLINTNVTWLVDSIRDVRDVRREIRKKNNGMLPDWYTNRKI